MNTAVHISNISKKLGSREVLKGISFDVYPGDMFGYLLEERRERFVTNDEEEDEK